MKDGDNILMNYLCDGFETFVDDKKIPTDDTQCNDTVEQKEKAAPLNFAADGLLLGLVIGVATGAIVMAALLL